MIGERLSDLRKDRGWKREELAEKLGLSVYTIRSYEQGKTEPDDNLKIKICQLFDISADYLIGNTGQEIPLTRSNHINLPADFPKALIPDVQAYIRILHNDYKYRKQKQ